MSSLSIQFHATIDELAYFVERWITGEGVHAAAVEYQPFIVSPLATKDVRASVDNDRVRRLIFTERPVDCLVSGNNQLLDKNVGALVLDIGRVGPRGMSESRLSTTDANARWRKIAADLKQNTEAGMVGVNEQSGLTARYRAHRYTTGAADMEGAGTPLRPFDLSPVVLRPDR